MRFSRFVSRAGVAALAATLVGACSPIAARTTTVESAGEVALAEPLPSNRRALPAGTSFDVRLDLPLDRAASRPGDRFTATLPVAVVARNGEIAVPVGAKVEGRVAGIDGAALRLDVERLSFGKRSWPLEAAVTWHAPPGQVRQAGAPAEATLPEGSLPAGSLLTVRVAQRVALR